MFLRLNAEHDDGYGDCAAGHIMSPITNNVDSPHWSKCSKRSMIKFIK